MAIGRSRITAYFHRRFNSLVCSDGTTYIEARVSGNHDTASISEVGVDLAVRAASRTAVRQSDALRAHLSRHIVSDPNTCLFGIRRNGSPVINPLNCRSGSLALLLPLVAVTRYGCTSLGRPLTGISSDRVIAVRAVTFGVQCSAEKQRESQKQ